MRKFHLAIFLILTVAFVLYGGKVSAQFSAYNRSYNKWDRIVFRNNPPLHNRIYSQTEMNIGYGARWLDQPYEIRRGGVATMVGYRYSRDIAIGLGAGIETYNSGTVAPIYAEGQIYLNGLTYGSVKPFLTGATGYLANVSGTHTNISVFANPSFGFLIPSSYRSSVMVSVGLFTQWEISVQRYSFLNMKIGVRFY